MTRKSRFWILLVLISLFATSAPLVILYAQGWRINLESLRIEKVGGIFLSLQDADVTIKLNGQIIPPASPNISSGIFISNLLPKTYDIEITKPNYQAWKKTFSVKPSLVTESIPIILVPEEPKLTLIRNGVTDFQFQNDFLIWRDYNQHFFLTSPENLDSALNLTLLFNHLKQTQLELLGFTNLTEIFQKSANEFLVKTQKARYLLDTKKLTLEKTSELPTPAVSDLTSPNQSKIATSTDNGLALLVDRVRYNLEFPNASSIRSFNWYKDSEHLILEYPKALYLAELDTRSTIGIFKLFYDVLKYHYDSENDRLYVLTTSGDLSYWNFE
ncbi:MAG: hypothetical protein AAB885_00520 [Patescibacteria group bacterium]